MKMRPNNKGIDWNRVPASQYDTVAALVTEAATVKEACQRPGQTYNDRYVHRLCYVTVDGRFMCQEKARAALGYHGIVGRNYPKVHPYIEGSLANALPTRKADQFADHVTTYDPQQEGIAA